MPDYYFNDDEWRWPQAAQQRKWQALSLRKKEITEKLTVILRALEQYLRAAEVLKVVVF